MKFSTYYKFKKNSFRGSYLRKYGFRNWSLQKMLLSNTSCSPIIRKKWNIKRILDIEIQLRKSNFSDFGSNLKVRQRRHDFFKIQTNEFNEFYDTSGWLVFVQFLEEIEDTKKTFQNYLTFSGSLKCPRNIRFNT